MYVRGLLESQPAALVSLAFQGGEPTLMGLDYFRQAVAYAERYKKPGQSIAYSIQTNGILLDDDWGLFLRENHFLVGISLDGPEELHDAYRVDKGGGGTYRRVIAGLNVLKANRVDFNILCTVNAVNSLHALRVYRFFRDELGAAYIQFIPIVERDNETGYQEGDTVTDRSVKPEEWGAFLVEVFDEWVHGDVGRCLCLLLEFAVANWLVLPAGICVFNPTCGRALALEHNGDLYSCDHFVEPGYLLGNIREKTLVEMVNRTGSASLVRQKRMTCRATAASARCGLPVMGSVQRTALRSPPMANPD